MLKDRTNFMYGKRNKDYKNTMKSSQAISHISMESVFSVLETVSAYIIWA
jgi:hypothetical protein